MKDTVLKDIKELIEDYDLSHIFHYHKTDHYFLNKQTGSVIQMLAFDKVSRKKGAKYHYIHLEEANEMPYELFKQLNIRLEDNGKIYISFNPDDAMIWIKRELEDKRSDVKVIKSSYLDNPHLGQSQIAEIEKLKDADPVYWRIYGEGEYGNLGGKVYPSFNIIKDEEYNSLSGEVMLGLDYGTNSPTALIECKYKDGKLYIRELLYKRGILDFADEIDSTLKFYKIRPHTPIYADIMPSSNQLIRNKGWKVIGASKDVVDGLRFMRTMKIHITESSQNTIKELQNYSYKLLPDNTFEEDPVKLNDHAADAIRYAVYSHLKSKLFHSAIKTNN